MNDRQDFAQGLNAFALNLYQILVECQSEERKKADEVELEENHVKESKTLPKNPSKNLVACPFSVAHSLAFLWNAASPTADEDTPHKTAEELAKVLGFKGRLSRESVARLFSDFGEDFSECADLKMGHRLFVNGGNCSVKVGSGERAKDTLETFSIGTETADECLKLSDFAERVNKWMNKLMIVEGEGEGKVEEPKTSFGLMNNSVINLAKGENDSIRPWILCDLFNFASPPWAIAFPAENTTTQRFWVDESSSVDVPMMHLRETCRYGYLIDYEAAVLELDFDFDDFSMLFLVPDSRTGLAEVQKKLKDANIMYLAAQLRRQDTLVYVPKFKVDSGFALTQGLLQKFVVSSGAADVDASPLRKAADHLNGIFTAAAAKGGSAADEGDGLLLHKAVVVVGERGSEEDKRKIAEDKVPEKFMLDRPFVFLLKYKCNVVLIGHVMNPEEEEEN